MKNPEEIEKWNKQLDDCYFIMTYLHTYPQILCGMDIKGLVKPDELLDHFDNWISIYNQYKGLEEEFFSIPFMPIETDNFNYFIDLSNKNYPIIEMNYCCVGVEEYVSTTLFESVNELMLFEDNNGDIKSFMKQNRYRHEFDFF